MQTSWCGIKIGQTLNWLSSILNSDFVKLKKTALYVYHFGCRAIIIMGVIQQIMLQIFFALIEEGKKAQLWHAQCTQSGSWHFTFMFMYGHWTY